MCSKPFLKSKKIGLTEAGEELLHGAIGVIPTDTLYGIVASALNKGAVNRVYSIKGRKSNKSSIILISIPDDVKKFGCVITPELRDKLSIYWPGPVSVVLKTERDDLAYLHRGAHTFAFRIPSDTALQAMLKVSGPIIAPSANPEGLTPADTIAKAEEYFGDRVDFYVDGGKRDGEASAVVSFEEGIAKVLRNSSYFESLKNT